MTSTPDGPAVVGTAMIRHPKVSGPALTVAEAYEQFLDDHVHALLVADRGVLLSVVERGDLHSARPDVPAREYGRLAGRTVGPDADLEHMWRLMEREPRRRLAVVNPEHELLGLLCLKRSGRGFYTTQF